ncbi:MAG TPA: hypothetical protein VGO08_16260 [Burkholderiales bacterium]|nr:hypothetical protein [Burkholderiales bacterium]
MNSHDARYIARFLATSRIALGLDAHADAGPDEAQSGAEHRQPQSGTKLAPFNGNHRMARHGAFPWSRSKAVRGLRSSDSEQRTAKVTARIPETPSLSLTRGQP